MARTFNRRPLSVPTPSKNDVQDYFFTHSNFKGLSNDKNFLSADQETFSDCKNVYVSSDGLLKSRPAIINKIVTSSNGATKLENILDTWDFGKVKVYKTENYLTFINDSFENSVQLSVSANVKLVLVENKIFVFESTSLRYYNIDNNTTYTNSNTVANYIHVPTTKLVKNGVSTDLEPENELTTSYNIKYLFDNINSSDFTILVGKTVTIKLDDTEYTVRFVNDNERVLVQKLSNRTFAYDVVSVSDVDSIMIAEKTSDNSYRIYYSVNGKTFKTINTLSNAVAPPSLSSDGQCIAYAAEDDLYACDVLSDTGNEITSYTWVSLLGSNKSLFDSWNLYCNSTSSIKLLSKDTYSTIVYEDKDGTSPIRLRSVCLVCVGGTLKEYIIGSSSSLFTGEPTPTYYTENVTLPKGNIGEYNLTYKTFTYTGTYSLDVRLDWKLVYDLTESGLLNIVLKGTTTYDFTRPGVTTTKIVDVSVGLGSMSNPSTYDGCPITDTYVKADYTVNTNDISISLTVLPSLLIYYDQYYPFGSSYMWYKNSTIREPANIDMQMLGSAWYVAVNTGEIFAVDDSCTTRVKYVDDPLTHSRNLQDYKPLNYGIAVTPEVIHCTTSSGLISYTYSDDKYNSSYRNLGSNISKSVVSREGDVLTNNALYVGLNSIPLLFDGEPVKVTKKGIYLSKNGIIYSSALNNVIEVTEKISGSTKYLLPEHVAEIDNFYFAKGKNLYISSYPSDGVFKWYFPKINTETFDYDISNIHPISATEMAVFLKDSVYYIQRSENGYLYYKSKIQVGCKKDASIITSYDGKYIIFPSERGLVALSYQDFVASTEQTLTYLSDTIHDVFKSYNTENPLKLFKHDFWICCYKKDSSEFLLFDLRNNSWWPMSLPYTISKMLTVDDKVNILSTGKIYELKSTDNEYYDYDGVRKSVIDWYLVSQKLHLNATNYYKHISNITLISVLDTDKDIYLDLTLYNYRKKLHESDVESFKFNVDSVRTYVKRLNYSKVNEFQYLLTSNVDDAADTSESANVPKAPLSLSSITVKYKISGQVR